MKVVRYAAELEKDWNAFILSAKNASFLLDRQFMDYHQDRFIDHSVMVYNGNELVALLPANQDESEVHSHQGLTYGGLVLSPKTVLLQVQEIWLSIMEYYKSEGIEKIKVKEIPSIYTKGFSDEMKYLAFLCNAETYRRDVTITHDNENPLKFSSRRKRGAKKAQKAGVILQRTQDLAGFWTDVLTPNLQKKYGVQPVHSLAEIELLRSRFPEQIVQYNACLADEILAGSTLFIEQNVIHAQYISASDKGREMGALDALFQYLILEEYNNVEYFDFGIVNEQGGKKLNRGLLEWKEGFGSRSVVHNFYAFDTSNSKLLKDTVV